MDIDRESALPFLALACLVAAYVILMHLFWRVCHERDQLQEKLDRLERWEELLDD